jgi:3-deoxy-D-manno-octulosonic-acid transferase
MLKRRGFAYARRSRLPGNSPVTVLLLDTIGELAAAFEYAAVVFMGGSLVAKGGHNVLEPARFKNPIVFGPHMENFRDMAALFLKQKAALQIQNSSELCPTIEKILSNPQLSAELGRNAQAVVQQNTGATDRVLRFLQPVEARR